MFLIHYCRNISLTLALCNFIFLAHVHVDHVRTLSISAGTKVHKAYHKCIKYFAQFCYLFLSSYHICCLDIHPETLSSKFNYLADLRATWSKFPFIGVGWMLILPLQIYFHIFKLLAVGSGGTQIRLFLLIR